MTVAETPLQHAAVFNLDASRSRSPEAITPDSCAHRFSRIEVWRLRIHFRAHLKRLLLLDAGLIEDVGMTRHEAEREVAKPFWRI